MSNERRRQKRFNANLFADLETLESGAGLGRGVVVDVSLSGLAVETETDLPEGTEVGCYVEVPFFLKARVMRRIADGQMKRYGLRFVGQGIVDKLLLRKLLKGKRRSRKVSV